jgi:D-beta-D-heptose 7-phosphate kinase/D-beta-D-heptose 1-phosphate adenosyltransferase
MTDSDAIAALSRLAQQGVLVVGDAMLDRTVFGAVGRVSPEAPVPVLAIERELVVPGGAGNLVRNLCALGAAVALVAVVGDDAAGAELTGLIGGQPGVEPWLVVQGARLTTVKTRFVGAAHHGEAQILLRADTDDARPVHPRIAERVLRIAREAMAATSVVVLSDYRKGVLDGDTAQALIAAARAAGRSVVANVHGGEIGRYAGVDLLVPSVPVLAAETGIDVAAPGGLAAACAALRERLGAGALATLLPGEGLMLAEASGCVLLRVPEGERLDVAGVEDSVTAALAGGLAAQLSVGDAARLAALAAGVVLARAGTAVARAGDLRAAASPQQGALARIVPAEAAAARADRWRREGRRVGFVAGGFDGLRPGHTHLLEQARAACERLVVGLASDVSLRRRKGTGRPREPEAVRAARIASLDCVDLVVIATGEGDPAEELTGLLRPDVIVGGPGRAVPRDFGGEVLRAPRLAEPA